MDEEAQEEHSGCGRWQGYIIPSLGALPSVALFAYLVVYRVSAFSFRDESDVLVLVQSCGHFLRSAFQFKGMMDQ